MHKRFKAKPTYAELLFTTLPGITGIILLLIIVLMSITSTNYVWRRHFQMFSLVHFIGFPLFMILMVVHGCEFWFNWGWPLTILTIPFLLSVVTYHYSRMIADTFCWSFKIVDISITENKEFVMLYIKPPKSYKYRPGQYVFINVPSIKRFQWHPFSIASSPQNKHIIFMIKRNGDWTSKLIDWLYEGKKEMLQVKKLGRKEEQDAIFKVLLDLD